MKETYVPFLQYRAQSPRRHSGINSNPMPGERQEWDADGAERCGNHLRAILGTFLSFKY